MVANAQLSFADLGTVEEAGPVEASLRELRDAKAATSARSADRAALAALEAALVEAREAADCRPPLVVLAACLGQLGSPPAPAVVLAPSLRQARDDWLRRLETAHKSESALVAYRVAINDLLDWCEGQGRTVVDEQTIVDYLSAYQQRAHPAPATYYRRFLLVRRFLRWASRRDGVPDPFLDLEPPPKPRQERDWLTHEEFRRLLDAAGHPQRNLPGLAERDRLALLALVTTGLRRSELCALEWRDLDLDGRKRSLLVRCGKGGKPRRQPVPAGLARELRNLRNTRQPEATDPVFCGLAGRRLQETILADIIRRAATRAGIDKHVTAQRCVIQPRRGFVRNSATRGSSRNTSVTPTSRPWRDTRTSSATSSSMRPAAWSSSPLLEKTPQPRPSRILLQCQSTAPTVRPPTPNSRTVAVVDVGDTAVIDLNRQWKRATRWLRPALAGPQSGSQRPDYDADRANRRNRASAASTARMRAAESDRL